MATASSSASSSNSSVEKRPQLLTGDTCHLAEILRLLKKYEYSGTDYYKLGLHLGLSRCTLDIIAKNNAGDVESCLRECLTKWLEQADDVKSNGGPTHYSLIKALRKIEQNTVADGIDKEKHPACVIFAQCESNQSVVDCLPQLALFLRNERLIAEMVILTAEASSVLLKAVKEAVCADYHNLKKFAAILKKLESQPVVSMAFSLLEDYRKAFANECSTIIISREHVKITLPLTLSPEFTGMRNKFADLMADVARAMHSTSYDELKQYIRLGHIHLRPQLAQCQNTVDIIELIGDNCSLIDIALLEGVVDRFKVEKAQKAIQHYKDEIKKFHQEGRPLRQFLDSQLALSSPLQCETATITVNKAIDDNKLNDVKILMTLAFEALAPNVKVVFITEGNSFTITCSFPLTVSESLITSALENIEALIERGVQRLTIGYSTVYEATDESGAAYTMSSELKQQLYSSVYSSQGTMEQLLVSQKVQLLSEVHKGPQGKQTPTTAETVETEKGQQLQVVEQQVLTDDDLWVIDKEEVVLTEKVLARGSYGVVNVGTFRGLRVAVKSLHTIIISDDNLALFSREMSIASRVRHPKLVQFIGATKVGNPLILTELMSTSLHKELPQHLFTKQQILSIAQDVALGLNYLHLFKPQPIIHRDVSSPNVLLDPSASEAGYRAKLGGYGTAKLQECNQAYAAPEAHDPDQHSPAMDVYSYSVLLMEMTINRPPGVTVKEREQQARGVAWASMKSIIDKGITANPIARPAIPAILETLKRISVSPRELVTHASRPTQQ